MRGGKNNKGGDGEGAEPICNEKQKGEKQNKNIWRLRHSDLSECTLGLTAASWPLSGANQSHSHTQGRVATWLCARFESSLEPREHIISKSEI